MDSDTRGARRENAGMGLQRDAVQRGKELDVLATVYDAILAMRETLREVTRVLEVTTGKMEAQDAQLAEQGDAILALSNRIEALTRSKL